MNQDTAKAKCMGMVVAKINGVNNFYENEANLIVSCELAGQKEDATIDEIIESLAKHSPGDFLGRLSYGFVQVWINKFEKTKLLQQKDWEG